MIMPKKTLTALAIKALNDIYNINNVSSDTMVIQNTREGIDGDYTLVVFPFAKMAGQSPATLADTLGKYILDRSPMVEKYSVINGFLNFKIKKSHWSKTINDLLLTDDLQKFQHGPGKKKYLIEFSSPNTNKPLHLGHVRNNLLGVAISNILKATGNEVVKVNLVNDRGIHICKSMLAWKMSRREDTPESTGQKGDHLVGDYYVKFNELYKNEVDQLVNDGMDIETAKEQAPVIRQAHDMLRQWENGNEEVLALWKNMNSWVYAGFDVTYKRLGVSFDKTYYESQTYLLGKNVVAQAMQDGKVVQDEDNSVWIDLTAEGFDRKILQRKDGTSVYITQDIGTAILRHDEFMPDAMVYVVGNEQLYHFDILKLTLKKFGYEWYDKIFHLAYGMVELTTGKMKSREGTVVDADDLMDKMHATAVEMNKTLGKTEITSQDADELAEQVALAALKYFILKVDPKKDMLFDPQESIDFNGNTGPFVQYTYARICSMLAKANTDDVDSMTNMQIDDNFDDYNALESDIVKVILNFDETVEKAAEEMNPAIIANYVYDLSKRYNRFYQEINILREENLQKRNMRLLISSLVMRTIRTCMTTLLGIVLPKRM